MEITEYHKNLLKGAPPEVIDEVVESIRRLCKLAYEVGFKDGNRRTEKRN